MTLQDLKTGMVVETRKGDKFLVINRDGELCCIREHGYIPLYGGSPHRNDMTWTDGPELDIMKVFNPGIKGFEDMLSDEHNCIWTREEKRKMTVSEICKELGYEVEIVKE